MGKANNELLDKSKTPSEKEVQEVANRVMEKCRDALGNKHATKKNQPQGKICSPKLSLDKVSQDIQTILGQMTKNSPKPNKHSSVPIELKIQEKEFFKVETAKKNRTDKNNNKRKPSAQSTHSSSMNFHKTGRNFNSGNGTQSWNSTKSGNLNTIHPKQLFKKVPITRSEMQKFKRRIELSAIEAIKSPELIKLIDKEKVAGDVKDLMRAALDESIHIHKVPVIDVGKFINTSLKMSKSNDFPELKKIAEKKVKSDESKIECNANETHVDPDREKHQIDDGADVRKSNGKKNVSNAPPKRKSGDKQMKKVYSEVQPSVQTLETSPNGGSTAKNNSIGQGQSKTTGSLIMKQKSTVQKIPVEPSQTCQKSESYTKNHLVEKQISSINRPIGPKGSKNARPNIAGGTKGSDRRDINMKVRSNSTLRYSNMSTNYKPVANSNSRPPSAPRLLGTFRNSNSGMGESSHSYFGTPRSGSSGMRRCADPVVQLKEEVNSAIRDRKTFTVQGNFPAVRRAMLKRGWVEKYSTRNIEKLEKEMSSLRNRSINQLVNLLHVKDLNEICKKLIKSKLLGSHQVDFYWGPNYEAFKINNDRVKLTKINKFRRDVFSYTSKQGLSDAAKNAHWFNFPGLARINHPRTYALAKNGETKDFIKDFRRTAAMSLLKWIVRSHETKECKIISFSGKIPLEAFQFACNECYKMVIEANNQDIDQPLKEVTTSKQAIKKLRKQ